MSRSALFGLVMFVGVGVVGGRAYGIPPTDVVGGVSEDSSLLVGDDGDVSDALTMTALASRGRALAAAGGFASSGVTLLSQIPLSGFPGSQTRGNEMWGYVSPSGREYAIFGFTKGAAFVEVSDPSNPVIVAYVDGLGINTVWRDMATFGEYAYIVTDGGGIGLQVVDLSDIDNGNVSTTVTDLGIGYVEAHNVYVNPDSGFLYLCIPNLNSGHGLTVVSLADPANPVFVGFWTDTDPNARCHDVQVVTYTSGPNAGKEIAYCFGEGRGLKVADVTDKGNMFSIGALLYPNTRYTHQGWLSDDWQLLFIGDELDERNDPDVTQTTTYVADVSDPSNPTLLTTFTNGLATIDHNLMVRGNHVFEANYSSGLRVFDVSDINNVQEVGFFDTHPENDAINFDGAWGVYPVLPSGVILVSDRDRGLFVLDASAIAPVPGIPTIELVPVGGVGNDIGADPGDVVAIDVFVSNWTPLSLQGVRAEIDITSMTADCGSVLTLFNSDADENGVCDVGFTAFCPTCPGAIASQQFDGIFIDDCRADHFSQGPPVLTPASVTIDLANVSLDWAGLSGGGIPDAGVSRYVGTFVFETAVDAYGTFNVGLNLTPATDVTVVSSPAGGIGHRVIGATITMTAQNTYGDIDLNGTLNLFDLFCILDGFSGDFSQCSFADDDVEPCGGNASINLFDLFAVLDAFSGNHLCCRAP